MPLFPLCLRSICSDKHLTIRQPTPVGVVLRPVRISGRSTVWRFRDWQNPPEARANPIGPLRDRLQRMEFDEFFAFLNVEIFHGLEHRRFDAWHQFSQLAAGHVAGEYVKDGTR